MQIGMYKEEKQLQQQQLARSDVPDIVFNGFSYSNTSSSLAKLKKSTIITSSAQLASVPSAKTTANSLSNRSNSFSEEHHSNKK